MFCISHSFEQGGWLIVTVFAGAEMCELYELAGWEGGAGELSGFGVFLVPLFPFFFFFLRIGMGLYK